jgi:hypothetical protein
MADPPPQKRKKTEGDTLWIKDDTLDSASSEEDKPSVTVPTTSDEDYEEEEEDEEENDKPPSDFVDYLMSKYATKIGSTTRSQNKKSPSEKLPMQLSKVEI